MVHCEQRSDTLHKSLVQKLHNNLWFKKTKCKNWESNRTVTLESKIESNWGFGDHPYCILIHTQGRERPSYQSTTGRSKWKYNRISCPIAGDAGILWKFSAAPFSVWKSKRWRGVKFRSGVDAPLEMVSEMQYLQTKPVWTDKLAAHIEGVLIWQSDNYTGPLLNKMNRNIPQSNITGP